MIWKRGVQHCGARRYLSTPSAQQSRLAWTMMATRMMIAMVDGDDDTDDDVGDCDDYDGDDADGDGKR